MPEVGGKGESVTGDVQQVSNSLPRATCTVGAVSR